ncbi:MAG: alpha/beta hydrolase [Deltaproteobacteria bacterium]|nr:alpha/beta hydrolase [Deltaproteobacteria bacterium]
MRRVGEGLWAAGPERGRRRALLLPGLFGDAREMSPLVEALAARRPVLACDLPPGGPRAAAAALLTRLRGADLLSDGPFDAVTGSFGGLVAACLPPELLRTLAVIATLPSPALISDAARRKTALLGAAPAPVVEWLYRRHHRAVLARDGLPEALITELTAGPGLSKETLLGRLRGVIHWEVNTPPAVPTLWILGATDPETPWSVEEVLRHRPEVEVTHVPGGHRPYASHPGPLTTRLEGFWSR